MATDTPDLACEVKPYPFPVGGAGYGSVGQAYAIKRYAWVVYVACVAPELPSSMSWRDVSDGRDLGPLIKHLNITVPADFNAYLSAVGQVFR